MTTGLEVGVLLHPVNSWDWDRYESGGPYQAATVPDAQLWDETKHLGLPPNPWASIFSSSLSTTGRRMG